MLLGPKLDSAEASLAQGFDYFFSGLLTVLSPEARAVLAPDWVINQCLQFESMGLSLFWR